MAKQVEGTWRAHQVPFGDMEKPEHVKLLQEWMESYKPAELFDETAHCGQKCDARPARHPPHERQSTRQRRVALARSGDARFPFLRGRSANAGAGKRRRRAYFGKLLRDIVKATEDTRNFRVFGPDETSSNRLNALWEVTGALLTAPKSFRTTITFRPTAA